VDVEAILDNKNIESFTNSINDINRIIEYLRDINVPSYHSRMNSHYFKSQGLVYDMDSLYDWYIKFINNILRNIRRYEVDYCFTFGQIKDLLKFEPNIKITYVQNGKCFEVKL